MARVTVQEIREMLLRQCKEVGSQGAWGKRHGLSQIYVSDVIHGRRAPGEKILAALGLRKIILYDDIDSTGGANGL